MPAVANSLLRNFFLLSSLFISLTGCKSWFQPSWEKYLNLDSTYKDTPPQPYKQLVILRKQGSSNGDFNTWINKVNDSGGVKITLLCQNCDNRLMLLTGPGAESYIQGKTVGGGSGCGGTQCGPSGEDGPVFYSINFAVRFNDVDTNINIPNPTPPVFQKHPVNVAVFDTGVDSAGMQPYFYNNDESSCLSPLADNGWNFVAKNNNWADNYPTKHGTKVAGFVVDQIRKYAQNNVRILPVKIHDSSGVSSLFSILCGFAYAVDRHVQVINASFGYYAPRPKLSTSDPDSCALLLKEYVRTYLTQNHILLVAAAGNEGAFEDNDTTLHVSTRRGLRDLDSVCFYPASLARDPEFSNVIAVTTIDTNTHTVSPMQNFSSKVVDIGVQADVIIDTFYAFVPPNGGVGMPTVTGSSFATPIATGIICANYYLIPSGISDKEKILFILRNNGIAYRNSSFDNLVRNGLVMKRK